MPSPSRSVLAFLAALLLCACAIAPAGAQQPPRAVQGQITLPAGLQEPSGVMGDWGFAWGEFVDPAWQQMPTKAFAPVPGSWNDISADGKPPGENGWGSYMLQVNCPAGQQLAVEAIGQRTASRLFVNGEFVAAHGQPGPTAAQSHAAIHTRVPISREFACPLRITLHVSNFAHRAGGFVRPIAVAPADALAHARESRVLYNAALLATYVLTGTVALIFFAVRRRERTALMYGLFCLAMAVYTDMIRERLLLRLSSPQLSWVPYMWIEYLSWLAAMALFLLTLRGLFPAEVHRRVVQVVLGALAVAAVCVLLLPPGVYSYVALPGQAIAVGVALYVASAMLQARKRSPFDAQVLLAGMLAIVVTMAIDLLLIDAPGMDRKFTPIGFALFLLSPAVVIARRLSRALNAEERGRTLEENARLREDVERISRHDLKTPLNSILGVSFLLREDPRLDEEQRELVGVLQRAGYRMLEMVNLSLGLFRMETGTYEFSPEAVDLREVVRRVLVDLHSFADASGVTLYLQGSGAGPVRVRAEELLCYSIVANLVKNAVEATARGKQVTLALREGDPVVLTIHNPGQVPQEIAGRFFEKYVTRGKSGGTGLGTYSARLMARAQQGELQMRTGVEGTTLTLSLRPLSDSLPMPLTATEPRAPVTDWMAGMPQRQVLLVDDDEYLRIVMRRFLPSPPFSVETAANGQLAVEAMATRWPDYLLIDMEMPLRDGLSTVRWVREQEAQHRKPRCRVVMMSGNDDPSTAALTIHAGADRFLPKPVTRELLLATLRALEAGEAAPSMSGAIISSEPVQTWDDPEPPRVAASEFTSTPQDELVVIDPEWMEVFPGFVRTQRETVQAMGVALAEGKRDDLKFLAHRAAGGLATMGLHWAAKHSRFVERRALDGSPEDLQLRIDALNEHLAKVRFEPGTASS
jgi:signal transduction histidine kinase/DNA-binding response OmpR family regulator